MNLREWQWGAAITLTAAVVWMALPTFPMSWVVEPLPDARVVTWHSWFDPLVLGYAMFHAPATALAATGAAVIAWVGLATRRPRPAMMWWAVAAAAVLVAGSAVTATLAWPHAVALGLLVAGASSAWHVLRAWRRTGTSSANGLSEQPEGVTR